MAIDKATGRGNRFIDLTGQRFVRWIVLIFSRMDCRKKAVWLCRCDCGVEREVASGELRKGKSRSCGCLCRELARARCTHGMRNTPEWRVWINMIQRCTNPKHNSYPDYGGRGIKVCQRWLGPDGFANFYADMGPRPSRNYEIDRINNDGNYEPTNCRWATRKEQTRNQRNNRLLTHQGRTMCLTAWAEEVGISKNVLHGRLSYGWPLERALVEPVRQHLARL